MIEFDIQRAAGLWLLALMAVGFVTGLAMAAERWLRSAVDRPELTEIIERTLNEAELTEMVNAEIEDWCYTLHEMGLDDALPEWLVKNVRERMMYVARVAAHGRKSKSEVQS